MIVNYSVTTAKEHASKIDLSIEGIPVYRDKGYYGVKPRGIDGTMEREVKGKKLTVKSIRRNLRISRKRSKGERPYSVIKRIFHGAHVLVTTVIRVRVKAMFMCLAYNLFNFISLRWIDSVSYQNFKEKM